MAKQALKPYNESQGQAINIISEGTQIKGNIISNGDVRIDGELKGNIESRGRLVIGPQGIVEGEINCITLEVAGFIQGKVIVNDLLSMKATAQIKGDIKVGKLSVEPGSIFTGTCSMGGSQTTSSISTNGKSAEKELFEKEEAGQKKL